MISRLSKKHGVTLVELMIAIVFLAIAGVALNIMYAMGRGLISEAQHRRTVLERAQQQMERLKLRQLDNGGHVPLNEAGVFSDTINIYDPDGNVYIMPLSCEIKVVPSQLLGPRGFPLYEDIQVVYDWKEPSGRTYRIELRGMY